jgi:hypothetical protein
MLALHHLSDHPLLELSATMFRWITFLGLFQTAALSFTLMSTTPGIKQQKKQQTHSSSWKDDIVVVGAPWKKQDDRDEHTIMEDVFLDDEGSYAQDLDENYMKS